MPDKGNDKNQQIRIVTLSNGEHRDSVVIRLHKGTTFSIVFPLNFILNFLVPLRSRIFQSITKYILSSKMAGVNAVSVVVLTAVELCSINLFSGWIVRFMRGGNLLGKDVQVFTSISGEIPWNDEPDDLAAYAEIQCTRAGAFSYHFYVNGKKELVNCLIHVRVF